MTSPNLRNLSAGCVSPLCTDTVSSHVILQLTLTDRSVTIQRESSSALGQGCRLGFLGTLHMDVFRQRLEDEYDANIIITAPTVPYNGTSQLLAHSSTPLMLYTSRVQGQDRHYQ